jgi:glyoxylase-like metal-dependent hydrolase (beta-lactamase superfamily II)
MSTFPNAGERVSQAEIEYPFAAPPQAAQVLTVADGIYWLRMPLPFALDHINLWLLEDHDGWAIVDTGLNTAEIKTLWNALLDDERFRQRITRIVITHHHPDHLGLAGWLHERTGAQITITQTEWLTAHRIYDDVDAVIKTHMLAFYAQHGLDEQRLQSMRELGNRYRLAVSPPPTVHNVMRAGEALLIGGREWQVIIGLGHTPEHACLHYRDQNVLIAGDQILPKITPNIMLSAAEPYANPLQDYLDSFDAFAELAADTLVLPSHGYPFFGLHTRIADLRRHHHERLALLVEHLAQPHSAADLLPMLFRRTLDAHHLMFAMGESLAHLAHLRASGEAVEESRNGISYFQQSARGMVA